MAIAAAGPLVEAGAGAAGAGAAGAGAAGGEGLAASGGRAASAGRGAGAKKALGEGAAASALGGGGGKGGEPSKPSKPSPAKKRGSKRVVAWAWSGSRKLLTAEFVICVVILGLGLLVGDSGPTTKRQDVGHVMVKGSALAALFFILALLTSAGKGTAKAATGLATLVTLTYVFTSTDSRNLMAWVSSFFGNPASTGTKGEGGGAEATRPLESTESPTPQAPPVVEV